jgi:Na+/H+ antiporter NhaD/arsenite permease-like protein
VATSYALVAAAAIFVLTYALISLRQVARFPLERPASAMLGAALMLALGVVGPADALAAINLDVILLLVGMMSVVSGLEVCGFFDAVSARIARGAHSQTGFLAGLMVVTGCLSALVVNDTVVLLLTPIVVRSTRALGVNPVPHLVAIAIAANVGSVATEIGNPQNAYIAIRSGIPFLTFSAYMAPVTVACLAVSIAIVRWAYRRDLAAPLARTAPGPAVAVDRRGVALTTGIIGGVVAAFFLTDPDWLPFIALAGGGFVLFLVPFVARVTPRGLIAKLDWGIILFFVGLFVVLGGVRASGLSGVIQGGFTSTFGGEGGLVWLTGLSALLSNLISNVPAVLLLAEVVAGAGGTTQGWLALAASSTLAGNATILGAAANVIVVQLAAREGVHVSMKEFVRAGIPVTVVTLVLATAMIAVLVPA